MAYKSLILTVVSRTNPANANDPYIGYWVCSQPNAPGGVPTPIASATLVALGATAGQPYATEALAQAALQLVVNYEAAQLLAQPYQGPSQSNLPGAVETVVYGPITT